jgi:hypothetical protein
MARLIDVKPESRFMALFIGPSKCGKTVAAASFRDKDDEVIDIMDFDGRVRGILGAPWISKKNIQYDYYPPRERGLQEKIEKKLEVYEMYRISGQYDQLPTTLILDSLTSATQAMIFQALPLTHSKGPNPGDKKVGRYVGGFAMTGPDDYNYESQVTHSIMAFFRSIPIKNIIVTAHIIPVWGKEDPENPFSNSKIIGEKLAVRDKIQATIGIYFDHCFRFDKKEGSFGKEKYTVKFRGAEPLGTSWSELPEGEIDITNKNFYEILLKYINKEIPKLEAVK